MIPELIRLGPLPINSFGLMVALALFAGIYRLSESFSRAGLNPALAEKYVLTAGITGLLGARLWFIWEHWHSVKNDIVGAVFASAGFTFYGGFMVAAIVLYTMSKRDKIPLLDFMGALGPSLALGYAIGRLGCQLSGDGDYGMPTTHYWGMAYPSGVVPTRPGEFAFPTPLYESAMAFFILWVLTVAENYAGWWSSGLRRFGLYLAFLSIERFIIEFLRINPHVWGPFSEAQLVACVLTLLGMVFILLPHPEVRLRE